MSFLSTETLKKLLPNLIDSYDPKRIQHGAYELSLGNEAFITSSDNEVKIQIDQQLSIPAGQFALLISEEIIEIPNNLLAFISMKYTVKKKGLINISGFHVDPGFKGRLKFSVYNAGSRSIVLDKGWPLFLIWFSTFDKTIIDSYDGKSQNQLEITNDDVMEIQGEVASPAMLVEKIENLRSRLDNNIKLIEDKVRFNRNLILTFCSFIIGILLLLIGQSLFQTNKNQPIKVQIETPMLKSVLPDTMNILLHGQEDVKVDTTKI